MRLAKRVKDSIKAAFPRGVKIYRDARRALRNPSLEAIFSGIYRKKVWQDSESVSGRGSTLARTAAVMSQLPLLLRDFHAETLLDAGCGDFNWMRHTELGAVGYIGADVVPELIARNRRLYGSEKRTFVVLDVTKDELPRADVILCRDCLIHLSFGRARAAVARFKESGSGYLLATTHTTVQENTDADDGAWRSLNLQLPPFNFPPPKKLIVEDAAAGKCLGVWRLEEL